MAVELATQHGVKDISQSGRMKVPVRMYVSKRIMPDPVALKQLTRLAEIEGVCHHVVCLPDIHSKGRNPSPTGVVVVTRDRIIPMAVDKGINCGMRVILSGLQAEDIGSRECDSIFRGLIHAIPGRRHEDPYVNKGDMVEILLHGAKWAVARYGIPETELDNIEGRGSLFSDREISEETLKAALPAEIMKKGRRALGTLGGGNHFLEMQAITEILDADKARLLGLRKGQVVFVLHTGSRRVGSTVMRYYSGHASPQEWGDRWGLYRKKWVFHRNGASYGSMFSRLKYFANGRHFVSFAPNSPAGQRLITALYAAYNFGFVNRMVITETLRTVLRRELGEPSLKLPLLYDCSHVSIQPEIHFGETYWVHRHGASQALPASAMSDHPVFSQTGQPVPVPGSMGDSSYIAVANEGVRHTFHSVNHGAGRVLDKPDAKHRFSEQSVIDELQAKKIRLYRAGSDDISEQAPSSFKDVSEVIKTMEASDLATAVARLRPLAVLKG